MECPVAVVAVVPSGDVDEIFAHLADFARYPSYTSMVRRVTVDPDGSSGRESRWEVNFRGGVLMWTERDDVDPQRRSIAFAQTVGDFASFCGEWKICAAANSVVVECAIRFDFGMDSLAPMIHPIAARVLRDGLREIMCGLPGAPADVRDVESGPLGSGG